MNLLFYLHQFPAIGGIEGVTAILANALRGAGHDVSICSHCSRDVGFDNIAIADGVPVHRMPDPSPYSERNKTYLQSLIREQKVDVVIFQDSYAPIERNLFARDLRAKVIVCEYNAPYSPPYYYDRDESAVKKLLRRIHFALTRACRERKAKMRRRFLYENCTRYVLSSALYFGEFRAIVGLADSRKLRAIYEPSAVGKYDGPSEKAKEVLFVGTLIYRKGCDLLVPIIRELARIAPDWRFTIVGDGPLRKWMENSLRDVSQVSFVGFQYEVRDFYRRARIFLFPSRRESLPCAMVDASLYGCIPAGFDSYVGIRDLIQDYLTGILAPAFDIPELTRRIVAVMKDDAVSTRMGEASRREAEKFLLANVLSDWQVLLKELEEV